MTTLNIKFYATNINEELRNDFNNAISHEKFDMSIQLLKDTIAKLEKKMANENGNYSDEEVQAFQVQLNSALESLAKFEESHADTLEVYNKVVTEMS